MCEKLYLIVGHFHVSVLGGSNSTVFGVISRSLLDRTDILSGSDLKKNNGVVSPKMAILTSPCISFTKCDQMEKTM